MRPSPTDRRNLNQRYRSGAAITDGQAEPPFTKDPELHCQQTSWPGARLPHAWVFSATGEKLSTLDLAGHGKLTVLTGIGGRGWIGAARTVGKEFGIDIVAHLIGPRQNWQDFTGDWANMREIRDSGVLLVRPDHHIAWRSEAIVDDPAAELRRVLTAILAK